MKIIEEKARWKPMLYVAIGFFLALLFAFTSTTTSSRHFTLPTNISATYVTTLTGDPGNNGVPVPSTQILPFAAKVPTSAPNDGGTTIPYIEYGRDLYSSGTKTVNFKNTFIQPPACVCADDSAITACDVTAVSTTQATFGGTSTDKFHWICVGDGT